MRTCFVTSNNYLPDCSDRDQKSVQGGYYFPFFKRSIIIMKLTIAFMLAGIMSIYAEGKAQTITYSCKNTSLIEVFETIERQTDYVVFYNKALLEKSKPVTLDVHGMNLPQFLDRVFSTQPLDYHIEQKTIVIRKSDRKITPFFPGSMQIGDAAYQPISGRVLDEDGAPLEGVTVGVKGTNQVTSTDANGNFALNDVASRAIIVFTMVGYDPVEYVAERIPSVIRLKRDVRELDAIVVTGYTTSERRAITGSIASVGGEEIENMAVQSLDKAIQGRAAGVLVQTSTGVPGGAVRINIRGVGSINAGTEPMYIVDGVQLNSGEPGSRTSTNALAYINPNDIESVEILKDAAAAAIYGSQAANGVVLITTKKGRAGRTNFSLNYYEGVSAPIKNMSVLSSQDAILLRQEAILNNNPDLSPDAALAQALSDFGVQPDLTHDQIGGLPTYDWQSEAFKQGSVRNIEFSASGGTEQSTFYMSAAYNKHDGNVTNIDFERGAFRLRLNQQVHPRLTLDGGVNLSFIKQNGNTGSWGNTSGSASPQYTVAYMPPTVPVYNPDGTFNAYDGMPGTGFNPIQAAVVDDNITRQRSLIGNFTASYKILDNLVFKSFYGIDYRFIRADYYRDPRTPNGATWNGYLIDDNTENVNFTTNQSLNYALTINRDHKLTSLLGVEYRSDVREHESARANNFPTYQFRTNQSAAEPYSVTGSWSGSRRLGFFAQANYSFQNKIFASAVARYDGSSRFGVDNQFGFFPGISAGWDLAQENFMNSAGWIEQLKLRVGYGVVGNDQINNVSSRGFYQGGTKYNNNAALRLQTLANPNLGWERNVSTNIGLDFRLLDQRISGTLEAFHRNSHHLLLNRPLPNTSGFGNVDDNLGRVVNKGIEVTLNTINVVTGDFRWRSNFNISFLKNEVVELYDDLEFISNTVRVGYPLKIWYRSRFAGVNAANGRAMWYDKDGNITYLPSAEDNVPTEKGWQSDYFGGFNNVFSYKGFELSALFHFDMGRYMANTMYQVWHNVMSNPGRNTLQELFDDRWTQPGQVTYVARPVAGGAERNSAARNYTSTLFLQDASFIRLREVTLGYTFNNRVLDRLKVSRMRVYLSAVNLHTWTKWVGYDPEFAVYGRVENNQGLVPQTKSFTGGIQIGF